VGKTGQKFQNLDRSKAESVMALTAERVRIHLVPSSLTQKCHHICMAHRPHDRNERMGNAVFSYSKASEQSHSA